MIQELKQLSKRWREYIGGLLRAEITTDEDILQSITHFLEHSHLDKVPSLDELKQAVMKAKTINSPGTDGIPADIYTCDDKELTNEMFLPQDFKDVLIIPVFKNMEEHRDRRW